MCHVLPDSERKPTWLAPVLIPDDDVPPRDAIPGPSAGGPRGDHPRDVIPGPSAGDSLAAGNIDLPEEVANDELDDLWILRAATHSRQSDEIMMQSISLQVCTLHNPRPILS